MDEVTQKNSALVEENAATAKTLEHQADAMTRQVSFFRIGGGTGGEAVSAPPARPAPPVLRQPARKQNGVVARA
jgi:methyl-accepting chemotaxis protein